MLNVEKTPSLLESQKVESLTLVCCMIPYPVIPSRLLGKTDPIHI